jgi:hypothetical protein
MRNMDFIMMEKKARSRTKNGRLHGSFVFVLAKGWVVDRDGGSETQRNFEQLANQNGSAFSGWIFRARWDIPKIIDVSH